MLGSFAEGLVNNTINWYLDQNIAYFRKAHVPIAILDGSGKVSRVNQAGDIDYYGVYKGRYISFEVKETSKDHFLISKIRPHQLDILFKIREFSAISFLLINFSSYDDASYLIEADVLKELIDNKKKRISYTEVASIGKHIPISFPGIIDFLKVISIQEA